MKLLRDDLAVFYLVDTQLRHIHAPLPFHRNVHVHGAGKRTSRHNRIGDLVKMHRLNHRAESVSLFNNRGQSLGFFLKSWRGVWFDTDGVSGIEFSLGGFPFGFAAESDQALGSLLRRQINRGVLRRL